MRNTELALICKTISVAIMWEIFRQRHAMIVAVHLTRLNIWSNLKWLWRWVTLFLVLGMPTGKLQCRCIQSMTIWNNFFCSFDLDLSHILNLFYIISDFTYLTTWIRSQLVRNIRDLNCRCAKIRYIYENWKWLLSDPWSYCSCQRLSSTPEINRQ